MVVGKIMEINCGWISYCHIRVCTRTYICSGFLRFPTGPSGTNKPLWEILEVERVKHIPLSWCKFGKSMRQMLGIWGLNHVKSPRICGGFSTHAFFLGWSSSFLRLHAINFTRNPKDCNFPMRKNISQTPDIDTWRLNPSATTKDIVSRCFSPIVTGWISINSLRLFPWVTQFSIAGVNP